MLCCLGYPVAGNPTQYLMEKALQAAGLDWRFFTAEVPPEQLAAALGGMRAMGFRGGVLSHPHKAHAAELLDELTVVAQRAGHVTLLHRRDGQWIGENSDGKGLLINLAGIRDAHGLNAVVLGTGSSAAAISAELGLAGAAALKIVGRNAAQGEPLVARLVDLETDVRFQVLEDDLELTDDVDLFVNATPIGDEAADEQIPLDIDTLHEQMIVADVTFVPPDTQLIREARARGCQTIDGLSMIVHQACYEFQLWTDHQADHKLLREALEEFLGV